MLFFSRKMEFVLNFREGVFMLFLVFRIFLFEFKCFSIGCSFRVCRFERLEWLERFDD